jgi:hypothetical protein
VCSLLVLQPRRDDNLGAREHEPFVFPCGQYAPAVSIRYLPKMRFGVGVLCTCIVACICTVTANVEKTIFIAPLPLDIPLERELLNNIPLPTLSPSSPVLETRLPVQFPTKAAPRGLQYWYRLQGLEQGRRYEVRVCWPATVCCPSAPW